MNSWIYYPTDKTFLPDNNGGCRKLLPEMVEEIPFFMVNDYGHWEVRYPKLKHFFPEYSEEDWIDYNDQIETSDDGYRHQGDGDLQLKGDYTVLAGCFPKTPYVY